MTAQRASLHQVTSNWATAQQAQNPLHCSRMRVQHAALVMLIRIKVVHHLQLPAASTENHLFGDGAELHSLALDTQAKLHLLNRNIPALSFAIELHARPIKVGSRLIT